MQNLRTKIANTLYSSERNPKNIMCLGCAIKVNLRNIVYPALRKVKKRLGKTKVSLELGNDCYVFETEKEVKLEREVYRIYSPVNCVKEEAFNNIKNKTGHGAVILGSFLDLVSSLEIEKTMSAFCRALSSRKIPFCLGKGHTIQASKTPQQKFILADYLVSKKGNYYGIANNDTIATIDFNLKPSNWLNVYISFNNALNDLYSLGVYKDIKIYPVYDSISEKDNLLIRGVFQRYLAHFKRYNYKIFDLGPLGLNLELIGATVVGFSDRELPGIRGLKPGQLLIVTRPVGDLSSLVLYILKKAYGLLPPKIKELKKDVLNYMVTPNIEVAKIISEYLPLKGKEFDHCRHITASKDITGEGISVFEVLALNSNVDIHIDRLDLHSIESSMLNLPNNTSCTNGPIVMAVHKKLVPEIMGKLKKAGMDAWIAGSVGNKTKTPTIFLNKKLKKLTFLRYRGSQLFKRYKFV